MNIRRKKTTPDLFVFKATTNPVAAIEPFSKMKFTLATILAAMAVSVYALPSPGSTSETEPNLVERQREGIRCGNDYVNGCPRECSQYYGGINCEGSRVSHSIILDPISPNEFLRFLPLCQARL